MTTTGGCLCGNVKYSFEGEPAAVAVCHCIPCRRTSNSVHSTNLLVPEAQFKLTAAKPKNWARKGDSGKDVTSNFCPECGVLAFVVADAMPGTILVKAGTLDDLSLNNKWKPGVELYARNKFEWVPEYEGVKTFQGTME